jgi:hypothetical protein
VERFEALKKKTPDGAHVHNMAFWHYNIDKYDPETVETPREIVELELLERQCAKAQKEFKIQFLGRESLGNVMFRGLWGLMDKQGKGALDYLRTYINDPTGEIIEIHNFKTYGDKYLEKQQ